MPPRIKTSSYPETTTIIKKEDHSITFLMPSDQGLGLIYGYSHVYTNPYTNKTFRYTSARCAPGLRVFWASTDRGSLALNHATRIVRQHLLPAIYDEVFPDC